jgi:hypothetical protein
MVALSTIILVLLVLFVACFLYFGLRNVLLPGVFYSPSNQSRWFGHWSKLFKNIHRIHEWKFEQALEAEAAGVECIQRAGPFVGLVEVLSPRMLQYVLKDNFDNFLKGPAFRAIFGELLGGGIFNVDVSFQHARHIVRGA